MPRYLVENSGQGSFTFPDALLCIPPTSTLHFLCGQRRHASRTGCTAGFPEPSLWVAPGKSQSTGMTSMQITHTFALAGISVPGVRLIWVLERWEGLSLNHRGQGRRPFACTPGLGGLGWARRACPLLPGSLVFVHVVPGVAE